MNIKTLTEAIILTLILLIPIIYITYISYEYMNTISNFSYSIFLN